ncbi:MAG: hypothetical protein ACRD3W_32130, partial [Terriglobales bacterium]
MFVGIACLFVFLFMASLMYSRRLSAMLALPLMAIVIAIIGGIPGPDILGDVINKGATKLNNTYTTTMFGAVLAELMNKQGIARTVIRWVAEFAGDNPFMLGVAITLVTALLFSTLGGLGAVIMVGTIVLPVMLSLGISNITAGALFLFGISLGGMFNIAGWALYIDVLKIDRSQIIAFVLPYAMLISMVVIAFLAIELRNKRNWRYVVGCYLLIGIAFRLLTTGDNMQVAAAAAGPDPESIFGAGGVLLFLLTLAFLRHKMDVRDNPGFALLSPILPLVLVLAFHWDFIPAFVFGIT